MQTPGQMYGSGAQGKNARCSLELRCIRAPAAMKIYGQDHTKTDYGEYKKVKRTLGIIVSDTSINEVDGII